MAKISLWLLVPGGLAILRAIISLPAVYRPNVPGMAALIGLGAVLGLVSVVVNIAIGIMIPVRLFLFALAGDGGSPKHKHHPWPWDLFWPFFLVAILIALVIFGLGLASFILGWIVHLLTHRESLAVVVGAVIFAISTIYFANLFSQAPFALLENDKHGRAALKESVKLVRGRWWATFWLTLVPGLLYLLAFLIVTIIFVGILGSVSYAALSQKSALGLVAAVPVFAFIFIAISFAFSIILRGYLYVTRAKLFHSLKHSR